MHLLMGIMIIRKIQTSIQTALVLIIKRILRVLTLTLITLTLKL